MCNSLEDFLYKKYFLKISDSKKKFKVSCNLRKKNRMFTDVH